MNFLGKSRKKVSQKNHNTVYLGWFSRSKSLMQSYKQAPSLLEQSFAFGNGKKKRGRETVIIKIVYIGEFSLSFEVS